MDQLRTARRSASHGSLNRGYTTTTQAYPPHPRMPPSRAFPRRLRSVNENSSLLVSPGPLESMLKTTTETGDIGLFSIRPVRSSSTLHGPLRTRQLVGDPGYIRPSISDGVGIGTSVRRDDRRHQPSYRDTASEIISMYGSDSQRSVSSSFAPAFDDLGHRAYSLTSCSSRPLPKQKSNGTMQSQSSGSLLQRPRSPFPYPTRLKRPGVRPSSPALTESGVVDYSRMVAIDRVSHVSNLFCLVFAALTTFSGLYTDRISRHIPIMAAVRHPIHPGSIATDLARHLSFTTLCLHLNCPAVSRRALLQHGIDLLAAMEAAYQSKV